MAYEVLWEPPRGAYRKYTGHVTDDELVESVSRLYGDPRFDDLRYIINDFLSIESFAVTEDTVTYIAAISGAAARSNPNIRVALLVSEARGKSLAELYVDAPWTVFPAQIFPDIETARVWLASDQAASKA